MSSDFVANYHLDTSIDSHNSSFSQNGFSPPSENYLNAYISSDIIQRTPVTEPARKKIIRYIAQGIAIPLGASGNIVFAPLAGKLAGDNEAYKWTLIVSNTIAFGTLTTWLLLKLVNQATAQSSEAEQKLTNNDVNKFIKTGAKATAVVLGLISLIPSGYIAFVYNNNSVGAAILVVLSNASYPISSLDLSFQEILKHRFLNPTEKQLLQAKNFLIDLLKRKKEELLEMTPENQSIFLSQVRQIRENTEINEEVRLSLFLQLFIEPWNTNQPAKAHLLISAAKLLAGTGGLFAAGMLLSHYWTAAYLSVHLIAQNPDGSENPDAEPWALGTAAFVTACNAYLTTGYIVRSFVSSVDVIADVCKRKIKLSSSAYLKPKIARVFQVVSLGIASMSYGGAVQFSRDNFHGKYEKVVEIGSAIANATIVNTAMQSTIDESITKGIANFGTGESQEMAKVFNEIDVLMAKINKSSKRDFAFALITWMRLFGDDWTSKLPIKESELNSYISTIYESGEGTPLTSSI